MNTADIFSLLHLFHLFTFLWHRPTLSKRCIPSFKAVGLGLFTFKLSVWGKQMAKTISFANRIRLHIRLSTRQQMRYM